MWSPPDATGRSHCRLSIWLLLTLPLRGVLGQLVSALHGWKSRLSTQLYCHGCRGGRSQLFLNYLAKEEQLLYASFMSCKVSPFLWGKGKETSSPSPWVKESRLLLSFFYLHSWAFLVYSHLRLLVCDIGGQKRTHHRVVPYALGLPNFSAFISPRFGVFLCLFYLHLAEAIRKRHLFPIPESGILCTTLLFKRF